MAKHLLLAGIILSSIFVAASSHAEDICSNFLCDGTQLTQRELTADQVQSMPAALRAELQSRAEELANIWGDTILEGDYYADEAITLDSIAELYRAEKFVGYRITYSAQAWDTSSCEFDTENLSTLNSCDTGRIVESGYVSPDLKSSARDSSSFAEFRKN